MSHPSTLQQQVLDDREIRHCIHNITSKIQQHPISDIVDDQGHQYVDLVLEGGGVLGIALAGYTYALEQAGIRFLNIAGTSAGAINAVFLATLAKPNQMRSDKLLELLSRMPMQEFIDGGKLANYVVEALQSQQSDIWKKKFSLSLLKDLRRFLSKERIALNSGQRFEQWLTENLSINHIADLEQHLKLAPNTLKLRPQRESEGACPMRAAHAAPLSDQQRIEKIAANVQLCIVSADISTQSKIVFPRMAELYQQQQLTLAKCVRASMAIPIFFEPVLLQVNPQADWGKWVGYEGQLPEQSALVDGGIMSNFPIDIFHQRQYVPLCPTFGAKLDTDREHPQNTQGLLAFLSALFDTARHTSDFNFLHQNQDYRHLISYIEIARHKVPAPALWYHFKGNQAREIHEFHWLDFQMPLEKQLKLFKLGVAAAADFILGNQDKLQHQNHVANFKQRFHLEAQQPTYIPKPIAPFDWQAYKHIRAQLL